MLQPMTYFVYIGLSAALTLWVGRTLFRNGRIFLIESFDDNVEMADSVNQLLIVGFYLLNVGFVAFYLQAGSPPDTTVEAIKFVSAKIGVVAIVMGVIHYFNVFNIAKIRRKAKARREREASPQALTPPNMEALV